MLFYYYFTFLGGGRGGGWEVNFRVTQAKRKFPIIHFNFTELFYEYVFASVNFTQTDLTNTPQPASSIADALLLQRSTEKHLSKNSYQKHSKRSILAYLFSLRVQFGLSTTRQPFQNYVMSNDQLDCQRFLYLKSCCPLL